MNKQFETWYASYYGKLPEGDEADDLREAFESGYHLAQEEAFDKVITLLKEINTWKEQKLS
jgi:hypothetical protein